jgi:ABC-2 type transport system ATP-binding protein
MFYICSVILYYYTINMLQINSLSFGYSKTSVLLDNISLALKSGHVYGLLGINGAGKSTLLKNMTGLATPRKGSCKYNDIDVSDRPVRVLEDIFFIPEELFVPSLTPAQFSNNTAGFYPKFSQPDYYKYLRSFDVDPHGIMDEQSYGQQKKAMIAFGLASNTDLLIMDEPTNGLDIPSKVQFRKLIASIQTEHRCIIISTHQVRDLDSLIDTLLVLHDKQIIVNKSIDEIAERLHFAIDPNTDGLQLLYEEGNIRGKYVITPNTTGEFSKPDVELLFNAIIAGNPSLLEILKAP